MVKREGLTINTSLERALYGIRFVLTSGSPSKYQINIRWNYESVVDNSTKNELKRLTRSITDPAIIRRSVDGRINSSLIAFNTAEHDSMFHWHRKDITAFGGDIWHEVKSIGVDLENIGLKSKNVLRYNDIVCLAGDLYEDFKELEEDDDIYHVLVNYKQIEVSGIGDVENLLPWHSNKIRTLHYVAYASRNFAHFRIPYKLNQPKPTDTPPDHDKSTDPNAVQTYKFWHEQAQIDAYNIGGASPATSSAKPELLMRAFAMNAFADHFLEDLFATGHMRVPRREINYSLNFIRSGEDPLLNLDEGLAMHDEDNEFGLFVKCLCDCPGTSQNHGIFVACKKYWNGRGDSNLHVSPEHAQKADTAVHISVYEVKDAYEAGQKHDKTWKPRSHAVQHIPMPYPPGIEEDQMDITDPWNPQYAMTLDYALQDQSQLAKIALKSGIRGKNVAVLKWLSGGPVKDFVRGGNSFPRYIVDAYTDAVWERVFGTDNLDFRYFNFYAPWKRSRISSTTKSKLYDIYDNVFWFR